MSSEELAFGKTKVFIRSPKTVSQREHLHLGGGVTDWREDRVTVWDG